MRLAEALAQGYVLDLDGGFGPAGLDRSVWIPHHLPQWSSAAASAARYAVIDGRLHLHIDPDQPPWCPEYDGHTRVSSLQTGVLAGPVGSQIGQHRFNPAAVVREAQHNRRLHTPHLGVVRLRARFPADPNAMAALWMIGYEDAPERSAEICVCEIFGRDVTATAAGVGMGVHPFGDPAITDDFQRVTLPIDVTDWHEYAVRWTPEDVTFYVDDEPVRRVTQSPAYPMQLMLGLYHFGEAPPTRRVSFVIDRLRTYAPTS